MSPVIATARDPPTAKVRTTRRGAREDNVHVTYRRSLYVVCYWHKHQLVFESYATHVRVAAPPRWPRGRSGARLQASSTSQPKMAMGRWTRPNRCAGSVDGPACIPCRPPSNAMRRGSPSRCLRRPEWVTCLRRCSRGGHGGHCRAVRSHSTSSARSWGCRSASSRGWTYPESAASRSRPRLRAALGTRLKPTGLRFASMGCLAAYNTTMRTGIGWSGSVGNRAPDSWWAT